MQLKPTHVFSPRTLLRRLAVAVRPPKGTQMDVTLPWGDVLTVNPQEIIGGDIIRQGVFDLAASELAWRLIRPGHLVVDVGANIGFCTLLYSRRVSPGGWVHAFEPHPQLAGVLRANVARMQARRGGNVTVQEAAVAADPGRMLLAHSHYFAVNQGISRLMDDAAVARDPELVGHRVEVTTLDDVFPTDHIDFLKIDVEGHEAAVMQGASKLFLERRVRHVLFEAEQHGESPGVRELREIGYEIFLPGHRFWGPRLDPPTAEAAVDKAWETPNCLATLDPQGVRAAMAGWGWQVLRG